MNTNQNMPDIQSLTQKKAFLISNGFLDKHDADNSMAENEVHFSERVESYFHYVQSKQTTKKQNSIMSFNEFVDPNIQLMLLEFDFQYPNAHFDIKALDESAYELSLTNNDKISKFVLGLSDKGLISDSRCPPEFIKEAKKDNYTNEVMRKKSDCVIMLSIEFKSWCLYSESGQGFMYSMGQPIRQCLDSTIEYNRI